MLIVDEQTFWLRERQNNDKRAKIHSWSCHMSYRACHKQLLMASRVHTVSVNEKKGLGYPDYTLILIHVLYHQRPVDPRERNVERFNALTPDNDSYSEYDCFDNLIDACWRS